MRGEVTIVVYRGAGAYICGEETALLDSLEGKRGQPRPRPPFPAISGRLRLPTVINNVEHDRDRAADHRDGRRRVCRIGVENSPGHAIFSISGNVANPANYELELGTSDARADLRPRRRHRRRA
jgi:NADH-quinone oxidoreductase subunit F